MLNKPLNIQDIYRASEIKRWQIVKTRQDQDVAQHSFNVAHIASEILIRLINNGKNNHIFKPKDYDTWFRYAIEWSIMHDISEILTGDIPTPVKKMLCKSDAMESITVVKYVNNIPYNIREDVLLIVKISDILCGICYVSFEGVGVARSREVLYKLKKSLDKKVKKLNKKLLGVNEVVIDIQEDLLNGEKTYL